MTRSALGLALGLGLVVGCGSGTPPPEPFPPEPPPEEPAPVATAAPGWEEPAAEELPLVAKVLERLAAVRGLPVKRPVKTSVLGREEMLAKIRAKVDDEIPKDVVEHQGELVVGLELVPASFDFVEGVYELIGDRVAGFYDPEADAMYLADDLDRENAILTLAHELVHALQDQNFPAESMLEYKPGDSDRTAAGHALLEGEAVAAMLDVVASGAEKMTPEGLRESFSASAEASTVGNAAPPFLKSSLTAPYVDGFTAILALRARGGWKAVDEVWRALPESTEQLLHLEKLAAREPPVVVPPPTIAPLGAGWRAVLDDVMGEQGLRLAFEEWTTRADAARAAAGWGGDRYVIARSDSGSARKLAVAMDMRFDAQRDADEVARVLRKRFGAACRERAALGPVAWRQRGKAIGVVLGPWERPAKKAEPHSAASCKDTQPWLDAIVK